MTEHHARTRTRTRGATPDTTPAAAGARQTAAQPQTRPTGRNPRAADQGPQRAGRPVTVRNTGPAHQPQPLTLDARIRLALGHANSAAARTGDNWPPHRAPRAPRRGRNGKTR